MAFFEILALRFSLPISPAGGWYDVYEQESLNQRHYGRGLAGLSIGVNLTRRGSPVVLVEKESEVGGLGRSQCVQNVIFDYGPHVMRTSDGNLVEWISSLVNLRQYHTRAAIYKYGKLFDFVIPVIPWSNIGRLPSSVVSKVQAELKSLTAPPTDSEATNFQDFIVKRVGTTLYWEFFGEYSAKWWGISPKLLSIDIAPRGLVIGNDSSYAHVTTGFAVPKREFYPENGGYGSIGEALYNLLLRKDANFLLNSKVTDVETDGQSVTKVWLGDGGDQGNGQTVLFSAAAGCVFNVRDTK